MIRLSRLLCGPLLLACLADPALAQRVTVSQSTAASAVTMGGDVTGQSSAATVAKINGNTPGGSCASGLFANAIDSSGRPTCGTPNSTGGFGYGTIQPVSNQYYGFLGETYGSPVAGSATTNRCHIVTPAKTITVKALGIYVITAASGGNVQLALYNTTSDGRYAGTLIDKTANISTTNAGGVAGALGAVQTLQANTLYALCVAVDNATVIVSGSGTSVAAISGFTNINSAPRSSSTGIGGFTYGGQTFGTWPSDLTSATPTEYAAIVPTGFPQAN